MVTKSHEIRRKIKCAEGEKVGIKFRVKYDNISGKMNHFRPIFDLKCPIGSPCKFELVSKRYLLTAVECSYTGRVLNRSYDMNVLGAKTNLS